MFQSEFQEFIFKNVQSFLSDNPEAKSQSKKCFDEHLV